MMREPLPVETGCLDVLAATASLAPGTKNNRYRGMRNFAAHILSIKPSDIDLHCLQIALLRPYLTMKGITDYLNLLKSHGKSYAELVEARYSLIMLGRLMAEQGYMDPQTPYRLRRVQLPAAETGHRPSTRLTKVEIQRLLRVYPNTSEISINRRTRNWAMIALMLFCGLRAGELLKMQWGDLMQVEGYPVVRVHGKYSKLRAVKLPHMVTNALDAWRLCCGVPEPNGYVFTGIYHNLVSNRRLPRHHQINAAVTEAARIAGLPRVTPHDLRRSFAHNAYRAGASMELIRQTLGHNSITMSELYLKAPLELERAATDIWAGAITQLMSSDPSDDESSGTDALVQEINVETSLTRQEAAAYLAISTSRWDRLRKKHGIQPWKTITGTTKPFDVFRQADVEALKSRLRNEEKKGSDDDGCTS